MQREPSGSEKFLQKLSSSIYNLRYILIAVLGTLAVVVITWAIVSEVTANRTETSTILVEKAEEKFQNWIDEEDEELITRLADELLVDLDRILDDYPKRYAAQRALYLKGNFYFRTENWEQAAQAFLEITDRFASSYLAPVAAINAAVSYEEAENYQQAITVYLRIVEDFADTSPEIPRVLFSLGRLTETTGGTKEEALEFYNRLIDEHVSSSWTNLARDRIIYLNID